MNSYNLPVQAAVSISIKSDCPVNIESNNTIEQLFIDANGAIIHMSGNYNKLKQFTIVNNGNRVVIIRSERFPELTHLSITKCKNLALVELIGTFNKLIRADLSNNAIKEFYVDKDILPVMCSICLRNNMLTNFKYDNGCLMDIDLSDNEVSEFKVYAGNKLASLNISNNPNLVLTGFTSKDDILKGEHSMLYLNVKGCNIFHDICRSLTGVYIRQIIYDNDVYNCRFNPLGYASVDAKLKECMSKAVFAVNPPVSKIIVLTKVIEPVAVISDPSLISETQDFTKDIEPTAVISDPSLISKVLDLIKSIPNCPADAAKAIISAALLSQTPEKITMSDGFKLELIKTIADNSTIGSDNIILIAKTIDDKY